MVSSSEATKWLFASTDAAGDVDGWRATGDETDARDSTSWLYDLWPIASACEGKVNNHVSWLGQLRRWRTSSASRESYIQP